MIAIITDTPAMAGIIARVLELREKKDGCMQGGGYMLACTGGPLVEPVCPEGRGKGRKAGFHSFPAEEDSGITLAPLKVRTARGMRTGKAVLRSLEAVRGMFSRCRAVINAASPCEEGELVFRDIYGYLECGKPCFRVWLTCLTDTAVRQGFSRPEEACRYDGLYRRAELRRRAELFLRDGILSALQSAGGEKEHLPGMLHLPLLAMVCRRYTDALHFRRQPFSQPAVTLSRGDTVFRPRAERCFHDREEAEAAYRALKNCKYAEVVSVQDRRTCIRPPLPHHLESLQQQACERYGYSADKTLEIALRLYGKQLISWPGTASRYISREMYARIPSLAESLKEYPPLGKEAARFPLFRPRAYCVDGRKAVPHHAILPTGNLPAEPDPGERNIYSLVALRMLEAVAGVYVRDTRQVNIGCGGVVFTLVRSAVAESGWKGLSGDMPSCDGFLPGNGDIECTEGELFPVLSCGLAGKRTKPEPLFTGAALMEAIREEAGTCGKAPGTPQARTAAVAALHQAGYINTEKGYIVPTEKGLALYGRVKTLRIAGMKMFLQWEKALARAVKNPAYYGRFTGRIRHDAGLAAAEAAGVCGRGNVVQTPYICPRCRLGKVVFYPRVAGCTCTGCDLAISREAFGKRLTGRQLEVLFKKGRTPIIRGFTDKNGKRLDARLHLDGKGRLRMEKVPGKNRSS